jgi:DNA-binding beta-propeller fold protein YncE
LFVTDQFSRVLVYALNTDNSIPTASGGHTASYVIGNTDFIGDCFNCSWAQGTGDAYNVAVDSVNSRLFVTAACVVMVYTNTSTITTGMSATYALGVTDMNGDGGCGATQSTFWHDVKDVAFDAVNERLFVADTDNNRVLVFNVAPGTIATGENASYVLGQTDFVSNGANQNTGGPTQSSLDSPSGVAFDPVNERLFVADSDNNRVLVFNVAPGTIATGENASYELGQPGGGSAFTTNTCATTQSGICTSGYPNLGNLSYDANNSRLFVADSNNCRAIVFNVGPSVIANGENATNFLGQPDWTNTNSGSSPGGCQGGTATTSLSASYIYSGAPYVYYDPGSGRVFVTDWGEGRILIFEGSALTTNTQSFFPQQF